MFPGVTTISGAKKPVFVPAADSTDPVAHSIAESLFWLDQETGHAKFFAMMMRNAETAMARLQTVSDLTAGMLIERDEIDRADVEIIRRLAGESKDKDYREMMRQITAAIEQGEEGIEAAHRTAARAVEVGFRWSIYYFGALEMYKNRLRRIG
jgi:hypothetical protein